MQYGNLGCIACRVKVIFRIQPDWTNLTKQEQTQKIKSWRDIQTHRERVLNCPRVFQSLERGL